MMHRAKRIACATIIFISTYILAVYIDRLAVYYSAVSFGYHPALTFWNISDLPTKYIEWSKQRVLVIFIAGSAALLVTTVAIMFLYRKISRSWIVVKLLALWLLFNSLALTGANIATSLFGLEDYSSLYFMNFSVVFVWWGIPVFLLYAMILIYAIFLFIAGFFLANRLLRLSHSQRLVRKHKGRLQVILQFYVIPMIIGGAVLLPFSFNNILFPGFHLIFLTLLFIGMIVRINDFYELHGVYRVDILEGNIWMLVPLSLLIALPVFNS